VVDWIAFLPEHIQTDIELFEGKTAQFIFISSASAYQTPAKKLPITEKTPLENPVWQYSRDKIACERLLEEAYKTSGFPYTIVRPSHTYDKTLLPFEGGFTVFKRILDKKPVVLFGDGSSIWTFTNHRDFAPGLVGLIGNEKAIAEDFHITNNELLTWNMIYDTIAKLVGKDLKKVCVPSDFFAKYHKEMGDSVLGDKMHSSIFDNSKIKSVVPSIVQLLKS
jgi:nucleoside-diphosphate-sugar epimerase